jgi:hypothetical protein
MLDSTRAGVVRCVCRKLSLTLEDTMLEAAAIYLILFAFLGVPMLRAMDRNR